VGQPLSDFDFRGAASFAFFSSEKGAGFDPSDFTSTQYSFLAGTFTNSYTYDAASNSGFGSLVDSTGVRTADRTGLAAPDGRTTTYSGARP